MDKFEVIAHDAGYPCGVLVSPDNGVFLIDLTSDLPSEEQRIDLQGTGWYFAAACGVINGEPQLALAHPLPQDVCFAIGSAYRRHVERSTGDSVDWLRGLFKLPDTRTRSDA
jgi:hypothetical protein